MVWVRLKGGSIRWPNGRLPFLAGTWELPRGGRGPEAAGKHVRQAAAGGGSRLFWEVKRMRGSWHPPSGESPAACPPKPRGRVFGILPAAGRSRRMGQPKLLLPAGKHTVVEHVLATWQMCVPVVIVVVHPQDAALREICQRRGAHVVVGQPPPPDMRSSVTYALEELRRVYFPGEADGWLLAPADMPALTAAAIQGVLAARDASRPSILVPTWQGKRGHPVYFPWPLAEAVQGLPPGVGMDALVRTGPTREVAAADPSVLADLDTPEAYEAFLRSLSDVNSA